MAEPKKNGSYIGLLQQSFRSYIECEIMIFFRPYKDTLGSCYLDDWVYLILTNCVLTVGGFFYI